MGDAISDWIAATGVKVLVIVLVAVLLEKFLQSIVSGIVRSSIDRERYSSEREERLRERTIISLVTAVARIAVIGIALLIVLSELGVEIGPLLAGAGVAGFALGFGAQNLIKDFIAGIFIVLENQYRVGDIIKVKGVGGRVIKLTTRITVLRDLDGNVHYIPNGSIEQATNLTMEYAKINMDISVSYESDLDKVKDVVNDVGLELSKDEEWKDYITDAPYFARVSALGDSAVIIKIFGKVLPAKQWAVEGELRKRLKMAFDKNNIRIPYPQLTIHQAKKSAKKN
ncbi:MAG TPA: mechanosensitive ion channel family protein [Candidatus Saccharimonadales bacterium]|jgi:small conductance mechanosensitive channel